MATTDFDKSLDACDFNFLPEDCVSVEVWGEFECSRRGSYSRNASSSCDYYGSGAELTKLAGVELRFQDGSSRSANEDEFSGIFLHLESSGILNEWDTEDSDNY